MSNIDEIMERVTDLVNAAVAHQDNPTEMRRIIRDKEDAALRKHLRDVLDTVERDAMGAMRERAAVAAWSSGMDQHLKRRGSANDPREVGSLCAQAIRDLPVPARKVEGGADYTLRIVADSGYEATTTGRCNAEQYGAAIGALHGVTK